jgi:hypothetical protein
MDCNHAYYHYVDGELVCSVCGKPAKERAAIEDKIAPRVEDKIARQPEVKRIIPVISHPETKRPGKKRR